MSLPLLLLSFIALIKSIHLPKDAIYLKDVQVLTLMRDKMTTGRRSSPVKQLECIGGSACHRDSHLVEVIQCRNMGFDGESVNWKCEADGLHKSVRLGASSTVICEGYDYSEDPRVLIGSCGLEYELEYTGWKEPVVSPIHHPPPVKPNKTVVTVDNRQNNGDGSSLFVLIAGFIVWFLIISTCCSGSSSSSKDTEQSPKSKCEDYDYSIKTPQEDKTTTRHRHVQHRSSPSYTTTTAPTTTTIVSTQPVVPIVPVVTTTNNYYSTSNTVFNDEYTVKSTSRLQEEPKSVPWIDSRVNTTPSSTTYATTKPREETSSEPSSYFSTTGLSSSSSSTHKSTTHAKSKGR
jgi:hypothetical protein